MLAVPISRLRRTAVVLGVLALAGLFAALALGAFWIDEPEETYKARRLEMVLDQIEPRGVKDTGVLEALQKVPRHRFVPAVWKPLAYADGPLPIGDGQTISQPYIVAWMTELIEPAKKMRVLEIGTGSGYQAAVLAECVAEVDSIEVVPALGQQAEIDSQGAGLSKRPRPDRRRLRGLARARTVRRDHPDRGTPERSPAAAARPAQAGRTARGARRPRRPAPGSYHQDSRPDSSARSSPQCGSSP